MIVTRLKLANVRGVKDTEFAFKAGFNLIVGVNGVGKTTALEALAVSLAAISRHINKLKGPVHGFTAADIRAGTDALTVESGIEDPRKLPSRVGTRPPSSRRSPHEGPVPREQVVRERARRAGDGAGHLTPFDPVAVWWLDQRLARRAT